jgi:hypothetical protein
MSWHEVWKAIVMSPSLIIGGVLGGLLTGGFFGWIAHGRSIRPVLVFLRDPDAPSPRWQIQNVRAGPALNLRIRDYRNAKEVAHRIHAYALMPGEPRSPYAQNFTTPTYARQGRGPDTQGWGGLLSVLASLASSDRTCGREPAGSQRTAE